MTVSGYLQVLLIITFTIAAQTLACDPGEEFKPYKITYNYTRNDAYYTWYKQGQNVDLASCRPQPPLCSNNSGIYNASISGQTLVLTIISVTRENAGNYSLYASAAQASLHRCDLSVFAQTLACDPGEEFKPYKITYNFTRNDVDYFWYKQGQVAELASCRPQASVCSNNYGIYNASISGQTLVLTIINVTRESAGNYSLYDNTAQVVHRWCEISVFAQSLACGPGEEFIPYKITYNFTTSDMDYTWYKQGQSADLASCRPQVSVCSNNYGMYNASISGQTLVLTIVNVTRESAGNYSLCASTLQAVSSCVHRCDLSVFARPKSVSCQQPELQGDNVRVDCSVTKSYPSPLCIFSWIKDGINMSVTKPIDYQHLSVQAPPGYFNTNCSLTLPVWNLGLGSHEFSVTAYANVTGQASDVVHGITSSKTSPVIIRTPAANLESCPGSYVKEGAIINCACNETSNTFLRANTSLRNRSTTFSSGVGNTNYNFNFTRSLGEIICEAKLRNWTNTVKCTPKVAYGPDKVSLKVMYDNMDNDNIDLCDNTQYVELTADCSASNSGVNPAAEFHVYINKTHMSAKSSNVSTLTYIVSKAGQLLVQCTGNNSEFSDVSASQEVIIQVTSPPTGPPIIEKYLDSSMSFTTASNLLTVQEGMSMIRCRVEGGYPSVSSLFLDCGSVKHMSSENMVTLGINVSRSIDSSDCSCTAAHISSCYTINSTILKLDVQFEPTIISFNVTEHTTNVTVQRDSSVVFSCEAEGNPSPVLSLRKEDVQLGSYSSSTQKFNLLLKVNKTMTNCKDTGVYVCQAKTDQTVKSKLLDVYVKCMQQFDESVKQNMVYMTRGNSSLNISIPVYGYPEPTLHLKGETQDLDLETYNLTYINQGPPYGIVSLSISTTSVTVFQNYNLNVTNTEGSQLYYFQIKERDPTPARLQETEAINIGAIVGGTVAGILVIVAAVFIALTLKRKGLLNNCLKGKAVDGDRQNHSLDKQKGLHYQNILLDLPDKDIPPSTHYEEMVNAQYDTLSNSNEEANKRCQVMQDEIVEYENTVSAL